ncbi:papain-like protein [Moumouvirus australiensis]|uniref:Papain-like cysteine peptidase n=1 Tax=Moumouvirus australiensis TaxID=2109587 RepID=A0A2P1ELV7_9VIRU|nr:papain-like protein [Moumouvirus australiensis]AVL94848.1 papain-like protein [Moumouvirus australiensis]
MDVEFISLGSNCAVKFSIGRFNSNQMAYPFDWLITNNVGKINNFINNGNYQDFINFDQYSMELGHSNCPVTDLEGQIINNLDKKLLIDTIVNSNKLENFSGEKILEELKRQIIISSNKISITNIDDVVDQLYKKLVLILTKDGVILVHDHHINISWKEVKEKYDRRFERFLTLKNLNKPLIFIYIQNF